MRVKSVKLGSAIETPTHQWGKEIYKGSQHTAKTLQPGTKAKSQGNPFGPGGTRDAAEKRVDKFWGGCARLTPKTEKTLK